MKATNDYMGTLKQAGLSESEALNYLNEDQKESYEFGKFKEAQEKRYATKQAIAKGISKPSATETKKPTIVPKKADDGSNYGSDEDFE